MCTYLIYKSRYSKSSLKFDKVSCKKFSSLVDFTINQTFILGLTAGITIGTIGSYILKKTFFKKDFEVPDTQEEILNQMKEPLLHKISVLESQKESLLNQVIDLKQLVLAHGEKLSNIAISLKNIQISKLMGDYAKAISSFMSKYPNNVSNNGTLYSIWEETFIFNYMFFFSFITIIMSIYLLLSLYRKCKKCYLIS